MLGTKLLVFSVVALTLVAALACAKDVGEPAEPAAAPKTAEPAAPPIAPAKTVPPATAVPKVEEYSGCEGLQDLIPKLALPGTVTLSYYQAVQIGLNDVCDKLIEQLNKPENLKK